MPQKKTLFSLGCHAAKVIGGDGKQYVCPICGKTFCAGDLEYGMLTAEHVPPKSVGGRAVLLTCKPCNNEAGHFSESHLAKREKQFQQISGIVGGAEGSYGRVRLEIYGEELRADFSVKSGKKSFKVFPAQNSRAAVANTMAHLENFKSNHEIKVTTGHQYSRKRAQLAELKSAFLTLTAKFGYSYALCENTQKVRKTLHSMSVEMIPLVHFIGDCEIEQGIIVNEPNGFALIKTVDNEVLCPWPSRSSDEFFDRMNSLSKVSLNGKAFSLPTSFEAIIDLHRLSH